MSGALCCCIKEVYMKFVWRILALGALLCLPFAAPASAQYMFMDTNGDAVHTSADVMSPNGTQTSADIYVITNQNRDGSTAVCNDGLGTNLTINSYVVNLLANGGDVTYSGFTNAMSSFTIVAQPLLSNSTEFTVGYASGTPLDPGKYKLGTVTLTANNGAAALSFTPMTSLGPNPNSFGTMCPGTDFDNTYKLAVDWNDADGLSSAAGGNANPVLIAPSTINATEGAEMTPVTVTATDTDAADVLTITASGVPNGLTVNSTPGTSPNSATLSGTPSYSTQGTHTITWYVSDGVNPADSTTSTITIQNTDRAPIVTAPATVSGNVGSEISVVVAAVDQDEDFIIVLSASALPEGATFTAGAGNTGGTLTWTPTAGQEGGYDITFTATNGQSGSATTHIDVSGATAGSPPTLDAIANATVSEGGTATINVHAADADGDLISLTYTLPSFATLNPPTTGSGNVATTITIAPGTGLAGTYNGSVTATANGQSVTQTFGITVTGADVDVAPVVTAPLNSNGTEGAALTFTVTAFDADGDAITSLTASPLPTGATFTANAANTMGTFSWTPTGTQSGSYDVTFTAANEMSGSATTHIIIAEQGSTDQPPVVHAPECWTVRELNSMSFRVTASDPDGDAIASLTASTLPTGATFTTNAANTSGTFRWIPTITQSGDYDITFTASNALNGSDVTQVRVRDRDQTLTIAEVPNVTVVEGTTVVIPVSAIDTDLGDTIRLTACLPGFATLNAPLSATGSIASTITISPPVGAAGTYNVWVRARSGSLACETEKFCIFVTPAGTANLPPVITLSDDDVVIDEGVLLTINASATDTNGDAVTLTASGLPTGATFTATGNSAVLVWTPTLAQSGNYVVTITADDGHGGTTTKTIDISVSDVTAAAAQALVFMTGVNPVITPNEDLCLHVEPVAGSFATGDVNLSSLTLTFNGVTVTSASSQVVADANSNDVGEIEACFTSDQLATLFTALGAGETAVTVAVGGTLASGGTLEGTLDQHVVVGSRLANKGHGRMNVLAKPNPLNPKTDLSFRITRAGPVKIALFDARGRLVRTVMSQTLTAGDHSVPWDGTNDRGGKVSSGSYFFRIQAPEGQQVQRVTVLK
jgi:hypothetical protein